MNLIARLFGKRKHDKDRLMTADERRKWWFDRFGVGQDEANPSSPIYIDFEIWVELLYEPEFAVGPVPTTYIVGQPVCVFYGHPIYLKTVSQ